MSLQLLLSTILADARAMFHRHIMIIFFTVKSNYIYLDYRSAGLMCCLESRIGTLVPMVIWLGGQGWGLGNIVSRCIYTYIYLQIFLPLLKPL